MVCPRPWSRWAAALLWPSVVSAPSVPPGTLRQGKKIEESRAADEPEPRVANGYNREVRQGVEPSTGE
eukprot:5039214-Pleurochrysis_carterae.AAC.1